VTRFRVCYEIIGQTDGPITRTVKAMSGYNVLKWVERQANGGDYTVLWVCEVD